jgi:hypothetical protein
MSFMSYHSQQLDNFRKKTICNRPDAVQIAEGQKGDARADLISCCLAIGQNETTSIH